MKKSEKIKTGNVMDLLIPGLKQMIERRGVDNTIKFLESLSVNNLPDEFKKSLIQKIKEGKIHEIHNNNHLPK